MQFHLMMSQATAKLRYTTNTLICEYNFVLCVVPGGADIVMRRSKTVSGRNRRRSNHTGHRPP